MQIPPFELERYFARYEFDVSYLLCSSDCEAMTIQELLALEPGSEAEFHKHWLGYTESRGSPTLRSQISKIYETIHARDVLVHSGAEEAIFLFMHAMLQPGDHIIVHWPCYQSLFEVAKTIGCDITFWTARPENGWALSTDDLRSQIRPNTRAVVVNTPHNPTGYLMDRQAFHETIRICETNNLLLFSDEVYRELEHQPEERLPAACDLSEMAVSLGVMSKTYGLAGLRIGWLATRNQALLNRIATWKDYTTICNSAPSEFLAELALRHRQVLIDCNLAVVSSNLDLLDGFFDRHHDWFDWQRPHAGPIAFPGLIRGDVESFCDRLVKTKSVLLLPGTVYGDQGNHFRIGFGRKNLPEALEKLEDFILSR